MQCSIANTVDNLTMAKGNTSNSSNLGYEIITPNRLKLGRNNYQALEGSGIKLDMASNLNTLLERNRELYCEWYRIFLENIHMLDVRPNKWLKNSRLPVLDDIVLFVFNDSEYGKAGMDWRLGKITARILLRGSSNRRKIPLFNESVTEIFIIFLFPFTSTF